MSRFGRSFPSVPIILRRVLEEVVPFLHDLQVVARAGKKLKQKFIRLAKFTTWHTGQQPSDIIHILKFQTRIRKSLKQTNFQLRKLARYVNWHFFSEIPTININVVRMTVRRGEKLIRKTKHAIFRLAKPSEITVNRNVIRIDTRIRLKNWRRLGKRAHFLPILGERSALILKFHSRKRRQSKSSFQYRKMSHFMIWHFTPAAPGGALREWVSPRISHSRGDQ